MPPRYHELPARNKERFHRFAREGKQESEGFVFYDALRVMDPQADAEMVHVTFTALRDKAHRMGSRLYVVNLPEHPWITASYKPGYYERYIEAVGAALVPRQRAALRRPEARRIS